MVVAVVGLGLIGGSLAISLKQRGFASKIIGVDNNPDHCSEALALKIVDEVCDLNKASQFANVILLAIPVDAGRIILPLLLDQTRKGL